MQRSLQDALAVAARPLLLLLVPLLVSLLLTLPLSMPPLLLQLLLAPLPLRRRRPARGS